MKLKHYFILLAHCVAVLAGIAIYATFRSHPVLFSDSVPPKVRFNPDFYGHHKSKMVIEGFRRAMTEAGIDPETAVIDSTACSRKEHMRILGELSCQENNLPDGFCGGSDFLTVEFIKHLLENYGRIPKNILFAGIGKLG